MNVSNFFKLSTIVALLLAGNVGVAQKTSNPVRKVFFTLEENERIYANEYYAIATLNGNKFTAIIENTKTHEFTFVFNGKRITKVNHKNYYDKEYDYYSPIFYTLNVFYIDPEVENGYGYAYQLAGRSFVNLEGKVLPNMNTQYIGHWHHPFIKTENGKYAFIYSDNNYYASYVDGKTFGPYERLDNFNFTESGKYAFSYRMNGKYYVDINGDITGPYDNMGYYRSISLTESGKYAFAYEENRKSFININGNIIESYNNINDLYLTENGKYAFGYNERYGEYYLYIDGKTFGPYERTHGIVLNENGKYAYCYNYKDGKWSYNINGRHNCSEKDYNDFISESLGNKDYINFYGYEEVKEITSKDGNHLFYSDINYEYVVIDGQQVGNSPAINCRYNEKKNTFEWSSIEGKELVVYEYKLD